MNKEIKYVSPFKKLCITVGNLPTAYIESMSYYEGLTFLVNYLSNNVIPALNNNGEVVNELKDFVENYFENLDVQEEINNKLDEMAESGVLQDIITSYLQVSGVLAYDTVSDMKAAENLINGSIAKTLGNITFNDGYGSYYKIRNITNKDIIDNENIIGLNNYPELVAEKINGVLDNLAKPQELYLASFFDNNENKNNYLYASSDGKIFSKLSSTPWENVRDADIIYYNNMFYAITTETNEDLSIADLYVSKDLINWNRKPIYLDLGQNDNTFRNYPCDWFIDEDNIYLSGAYQVGTMTDSLTGDSYRDFRLYIVPVLDMNFDNFELGTPIKLTQINYNIIDPTIIKKSGTYYMFAKKEANEGTYLSGQIQTFTSSNLINWTQISSTISSLDNYKYEAPSIIKNDNEYIMYLDNYTGDNGSHIQYITSSDLETWSKPHILQCEGHQTRHGSVTKIENGTAEKIILSYKNKFDTDYITNLRKCIVLPRINNDKINKYIKIGTIICEQNYSSMRITFNLKDIENNNIDSDYYLSIYKSNELNINFYEEFYKNSNVNKMFIKDIGDNKYELYYSTLSITQCIPCINIKDLSCVNFKIEINPELNIIDTLPNGTSYYPTSSLAKLSTNNLFRIEKIETFSSETSIKAKFNNKLPNQGFSCIIVGRWNCVLFQGATNSNGEFTAYRGFDMTTQGKTYSLSTTTDEIIITGLTDYDEYTLLITDNTIGGITFSK